MHSFFKFSNKQTRGFLVLVLMGSFFMLLTNIINHYFDDAVSKDVSPPLCIQKPVQDQTSIIPRKAYKRVNHRPIHYVPFNPNNIIASQWEGFGVNKYTAKRIEKYTQKGGRFKVKADLLKIYGFPSSVYVKLKPFILLPEIWGVSSPKQTTKSVYSKPPISMLELNSADTLAFEKLPGIGNVLAIRILKYRNKLGGFMEISQLKEVYGLKEETLEKLSNLMEVNPSLVKMINVNKCTFEELSAHPYVGYRNAKMIVNYRKQHGDFKTIEDLMQVKELDLEKMKKAQRYFTFGYSSLEY